MFWGGMTRLVSSYHETMSKQAGGLSAATSMESARWVRHV